MNEYLGVDSVKHSPLTADQMFKVLSLPPEANILPSGDQASPQTWKKVKNIMKNNNFTLPTLILKNRSCFFCLPLDCGHQFRPPDGSELAHHCDEFSRNEIHLRAHTKKK